MALRQPACTHVRVARPGRLASLSSQARRSARGQRHRHLARSQINSGAVCGWSNPSISRFWIRNQPESSVATRTSPADRLYCTFGAPPRSRADLASADGLQRSGQTIFAAPAHPRLVSPQADTGTRRTSARTDEHGRQVSQIRAHHHPSTAPCRVMKLRGSEEIREPSTRFGC